MRTKQYDSEWAAEKAAAFDDAITNGNSTLDYVLEASAEAVMEVQDEILSMDAMLTRMGNTAPLIVRVKIVGSRKHGPSVGSIVGRFIHTGVIRAQSGVNIAPRTFDLTFPGEGRSASAEFNTAPQPQRTLH